jgi:hypothetical protein
MRRLHNEEFSYDISINTDIYGLHRYVSRESRIQGESSVGGGTERQANAC